MSGFTVGVAMLGALVLASLLAHNAWTSRRNAPRQADPARLPVQTPAPDLPQEPTLDPEPTLPSPERKPRLDVLIDAIAPIHVETAVSGEAAIAALPPTRRAGSKPFAIEGRNEATGLWET